MRVGTEFQANVPELAAHCSHLDSSSAIKGVGSVLVWAPTTKLVDEDIDAYLDIAKEKFGYGMEQALGMLYWHGYSIDKAVENMPHFCPLKDEWSMEDKVIFQQAFQFHGKNFQRIRAMLPDKPISSLVKYYYLWKKSYAQFSLMDKQSRRNGRRLGAGLSVSNDDTDSNKSGSSRSDLHGYSSLLYQLPHLGKGKQLPKGIYLNTMELLDLTNDEDSANVRRMDREILELKKKLQDHKQNLCVQREDGGPDDTIEKLRPNDYSRKSGSSIPTKWTDEEIELAMEVISKHGKDCEALSLSLEGKTVAQCRNFFTNYKRKLNLPRFIAEYELKNGHKLSRYGRQAKELVENGGEGLQVQYQQQQSYGDEPSDPKRARFDPQLQARVTPTPTGNGGVGYTTAPAVTVGMM